MLTIDSRTSTSPFAKFLNNPHLSDVILLAGVEKSPVYAHSFVLRANSTFYETNLSGRWEQTSNDQAKQYTINHPEIEPDVLLIILAKFYTGCCEIPQDKLLDVAKAAGYLLLYDELGLSCVQYFEEHHLSAKNAFTFFKFATQQRHTQHQFCAIHALLEYIERAVYHDKEGLAVLDVDEIGVIVAAPILSDEEKWLLLTHWIIAQHSGTDSTPVKDVLNEMASEDLKLARKDVKSLLENICLFNVPKSSFSTLLEPSLKLLPNSLQQQLRNFFAPTSQSITTKIRDYNGQSKAFATFKHYIRFQELLVERLNKLGIETNRKKLIQNGWVKTFTFSGIESFPSLTMEKGDVLLFSTKDGNVGGLYLAEREKCFIFHVRKSSSIDEMGLTVSMARYNFDYNPLKCIQTRPRYSNAYTHQFIAGDQSTSILEDNSHVQIHWSGGSYFESICPNISGVCSSIDVYTVMK
jgi:hypothetical protein